MSRISTTPTEIRQLGKSYARTIPSAYLDENAHVNVQYYVHLIERGLVALFQGVGMGEIYAAATEYGNFALEQHIRYLDELVLDDAVSVYIRLIDLSPKRAYFMGFLLNDTRNRLAATVEIVMMNIDMAQRRGAPCPATAYARLSALHREHKSLPWDAPVCGVMHA